MNTRWDGFTPANGGAIMIVCGGRAIYGETVGILVLDTKFP